LPQFDVFRSPGRRESIPYVVSVQATRLERAASRLVLPLVEPAALGLEEHWLTPRVTVAGRQFLANPFDIATLPLARLGAPVASLADEESAARLLRAIDEFISRA
jgi:toxin CcdB